MAQRDMEQTVHTAAKLAHVMSALFNVAEPDQYTQMIAAIYIASSLNIANLKPSCMPEEGKASFLSVCSVLYDTLLAAKQAKG